MKKNYIKMIDLHELKKNWKALMGRFLLMVVALYG